MSTQLSFEIKAQQRMVLWTSGGLKVEGNVWTAHQLPRNFKDQNKILKHLNTEWLISFIKIKKKNGPPWSLTGGEIIYFLKSISQRLGALDGSIAVQLGTPSGTNSLVILRFG